MKPADRIGSYVTALTLTGLPYATGKLMGKAPQAVLRQFEIWGKAGKSGLPRVVRTYWKAISPLGITRPTLPGVPVLELILYGQMSEVDVARDAHHAVTLGAKRAMAIMGKPVSIDPVVDGLVFELGTAIKQFWRLYARTCDKAREQVIEGNLGSAVICVRRNEAQILELIDEIESKSRTLASILGRTTNAGVDQILGQLITPAEYIQPDLDQLVVQQSSVITTTSASWAGPVTQPSAPVVSTEPQVDSEAFRSAARDGFPTTPKPERTAIQTSFDQHDEVDEAAARFATGKIGPVEPQAGSERSAPQPRSIPVMGTPKDQEEEPSQHSGAWVGVLFVLLSVVVACGVVYYFLFGLPF